MDNLTKAERSRAMSRVRSKDTKPEVTVRRMLHALGYRFRLHRKDLPGCPDIVLPKYRTAVFVHGCFWHGHTCRRGRRVPASNAEYWTLKIGRNRERDRRVRRQLRSSGWKMLTVWECELRDPSKLQMKLTRMLSD